MNSEFDENVRQRKLQKIGTEYIYLYIIALVRFVTKNDEPSEEYYYPSPSRRDDGIERSTTGIVLDKMDAKQILLKHLPIDKDIEDDHVLKIYNKYHTCCLQRQLQEFIDFVNGAVNEAIDTRMDFDMLIRKLSQGDRQFSIISIKKNKKKGKEQYEQKTFSNMDEFFNYTDIKPYGSTDMIFSGRSTSTFDETSINYTCFPIRRNVHDSWGVYLIQEELCERYTRFKKSLITRERAVLDLSRCTQIIGTNCVFSATYKNRKYVCFGEIHTYMDHGVSYDARATTFLNFIQCICKLYNNQFFDIFVEHGQIDPDLDVTHKQSDFQPSTNRVGLYFKGYYDIHRRKFQSTFANVRVHTLDPIYKRLATLSYPMHIKYKNVTNIYDGLDQPILKKELSKLEEYERETILSYTREAIDTLVRQFKEGIKIGDNTHFFSEPKELEVLIQELNLYARCGGFGFAETPFTMMYYALIRDVYAIARMLRSFEYNTNGYIVTITGAAHTENYEKLFQRLQGAVITNTLSRTIKLPISIEVSLGVHNLTLIDENRKISARMLAQEYFGVPDSTFIDNIHELANTESVFEVINISEGLRSNDLPNYLLREIQKLKNFINPDIHLPGDYINEYKARLRFKFKTLVIMYFSYVSTFDVDTYNEINIMKTSIFDGENNEYNTFNEQIMSITQQLQMKETQPPQKKRRGV